MRRVFVDTSAFVALSVVDDRRHRAATDAFMAMLDRRVRLVTTNYVFAETYTTMLARAGTRRALEWGARFKAGRSVDLIRVDEPLEDAAWQILETHSDKAWSYVDAVSFALMEREGISTAFAFDRHFTQRGLAVVPAPE